VDASGDDASDFLLVWRDCKTAAKLTVLMDFAVVAMIAVLVSVFRCRWIAVWHWIAVWQ